MRVSVNRNCASVAQYFAIDGVMVPNRQAVAASHSVSGLHPAEVLGRMRGSEHTPCTQVSGMRITLWTLPLGAVVLAGLAACGTNETRSSDLDPNLIDPDVIDGDVEYGSVMAGQSVGMVHVERPVVDIIAKLVDEANAALAR